MGDAISPGATVCTCAWMEQQFLANMSGDSKRGISAGRYMDDVISVCKESGIWDHAKFAKV